jgi:hypothetical protein
MKDRFTKSLLLTLLFTCVMASVAEEQNETRIKDLGADFRYRVIQEDARKLDTHEPTNDRLWQRYRLRIWTSIRVQPNMDVNVRLITEPRYYNDRSHGDRWVRNEILFDNLNLSLHNLFSEQLDMVIGRQQIQLADNWLVGEGTPLDGTRTAYFDAIRTTLNIEDWRTTVDFMWIENRRDSSNYIKPINDVDFDMSEQDESGGILWLSHEAVERRFIDLYFIYKKDSNPIHTDAGTQIGVKGETYTLGLRGHGNLTDTLTYNAEVAPQFGHKNDSSISAFAANNWIKKLISETKNASIQLGYEYLSGDSDIDKHFDKLWGREGIWSDLYTGGVDGFDGRPLDSSNLHRPYLKAVVNPFKPLRITAEYSLLFADKKVDLPTEERVDHDSMFRGHHVKASIEHKFNPHLKHYVTAQALIPGNYYSDTRQDTASWFRYGVELKW